MWLTPSMKFVSIAAVSATALLGACAAMDRDTMFENNGPPPASAPARGGQAQTTPAPQARASAPAPQAQAAAPAPQQDAMAAPAPMPAAPAAPGAFSDAQLQSFVTASHQIEPLNRQVQAATTPEQRSQLATQIRAILTQNNLDGATYNAIATRAQTDQALASRIAALQTNPNG